MIDDHTPQQMAMQQLQGSGAGQMNYTMAEALERIERLERVLVRDAARIDRIDTMETMLQAMADGRIVMLARIEALSAALREIMTNKDEDHWEVNRIARAALAPEQDK